MSWQAYQKVMLTTTHNDFPEVVVTLEVITSFFKIKGQFLYAEENKIPNHPLMGPQCSGVGGHTVCGAPEAHAPLTSVAKGVCKPSTAQKLNSPWLECLLLWEIGKEARIEHSIGGLSFQVSFRESTVILYLQVVTYCKPL